MNDLLILGQVPGTNIQITFLDWLLLCAVIYLIYRLYSRSRLKVANDQLNRLVTPLAERFSHSPSVALVRQAAHDSFQSLLDHLIG